MKLFPLLFACIGLAVASCQREDRPFRVYPPSADSAQFTSMSELYPGTVPPGKPDEPTSLSAHVKNEYEENAYAMAEGKRLFAAFNCIGCHGNGGGGMGPPLLDEKWIYGHQPEQVFSTIVEGRPNGMPSWGGKIPEYQIWQLAAYVRSMSGLVRKDAAPGRNDDMKSSPPENSKDPAEPVNSSVPPSAEMPQ